MAKSRSGSRGRGTFDTSNRSVAPRSLSNRSYLANLIKTHLSPPIRLRDVEDRRAWSPGPYNTRQRQLKNLWGQPTHRIIDRGPRLNPITVVPHNSVRARERRNLGSLQHVLRNRIGFADPHRMIICVRRKQRKEVMFATGNAGKRGQRSPRFNYYSHVDC